MKKILNASMILLSVVCYDSDAAAPQPISSTKPSVNQTTTASASAKTASVAAPNQIAAAAVDCLYKLTNAKAISDTELSQWGQYAARKSFDYSFDRLDTQLQNLKSCFTDQGWAGFHDALKQSGNLATIKAQQLIVSSQVSGKAEVNLVKPNQWRITVPLSVVYQNTQEKLTQSLAVVMIVTKKSPTELGIVQFIATPKLEKTS